MRRRLLAVASAAAVLGMLLTAPGARAAGIEYGWWTATPASPGAPADGIQISEAATVPGITGALPDPADPEPPPPFAPAAVGAVRFPAGVDQQVTLVLHAVASTTATDAASPSAVLACAITDPSWVPVQGGAFAARPAYDCAAVANVATVSGSDYTFSLSRRFQKPDGEIDVAIVPKAAAPLVISFSAPTAADIRTTTVEDPFATDPEPEPGPTTVPASTPTTAAPASAPDPAPLPRGPVPVPAAPSPGLVDAAPSDAPAPTVVPVPIAVQPLPATGVAAPAATAATRPAGTTRRPRLVAETGDGTPRRILFLALLVGVGAALFWASTREADGPRLIGPLAGANPVAGDEEEAAAAVGTGGLGRYARPRDGEPQGLR